ncbi:hypothetical protein AGMMS49960_17490 [Betaproteobacteria bacterium]|nr:hypothetical protein AGMMS49543_08070 [Betaproteobacteria bacterium]GHU03322.1 hypothetical protein AGMMS49960_17490 [Betaproteobacteria bacterium]GHU06779.1 hypothetical protein AGMMS50225_02660 [Betaproteobacteria bacterium]GHU18140.1 hypothetical protein AGMMS50243_07610 [Betaproteobacteria bacterium]
MKHPLFMVLPRRRVLQAGVTLIELMVSLVLGLLVVGGGVGIFLANRETNRDMEALARIHENAQIAFDLLGRSLREAGSNPCGIPASKIRYVVNTYPAPWYVPGTVVDFYEKRYIYSRDDESAAGAEQRVELPNGNTHIVKWDDTELDGTGNTRTRSNIRFLTTGSSDNAISAVTEFTSIPGTNSFSKLTLKTQAFTNKMQIGLVCTESDGVVWGLPGLSPTTSGSFGDPSTTYTPGYEAMELIHVQYPSNAYLVRVTPEYWLIAKNERGGKSLYRTTYEPGRGATSSYFIADEIAPDATDMKITYLLRDDAGVLDTEYKRPNQFPGGMGEDSPDWARVAAVRVEITFDNTSDLNNSAAAYKKDSTTITPIRRTLAQTITLRGRNLPAP